MNAEGPESMDVEAGGQSRNDESQGQEQQLQDTQELDNDDGVAGGSPSQENMEERVLLTPILGAYDEGPLSYLLEVDQTRILIDCGWNEKFDPKEVEPLRKVLPTVDLVLISFGDIAHMGALPYAVREFGLKETCKVYSTNPTKELGLRELCDVYFQRARVGEFDLFDLDDIHALEEKMVDRAFESVIIVQGKSVSPINIDAICAGRLLGGSMWRIKREPDVILYAVDFNHAKDHLLEGMLSRREILQPTLLIIDSYNFLNKSRGGLRQRKEDMCGKILGVLRKNKNVLMPVNAAGRILELLFVLNSFWKEKSLTYPVVWLTTSPSILDVAHSDIHYMNNDINQAFQRTRKNLFDELKNTIQIATSIKQLKQIRDPKVILTSSGSLETGFSKDLLTIYGPQDGHLLLLTDRTMTPGSLTRRLYEHLVRANQPSMMMQRADIAVDVTSSQWVYKTGQELVLWKMQRKEKLLAEARRKQQEEERKAIENDIAMDGMDVFAIIGKDGTMESNAEQAVELQRQDSFMSTSQQGHRLQRQSSSVAFDDELGGGLYSVFAKKADEKSKKRMFSAFDNERTKQWDEYGEIINDRDYMLEENEKESAMADDESESDLSGSEDGQMELGERKTAREYDPLEDLRLSREKRAALPRDCVKKENRIYLRCALAYVDMESRANQIDLGSVVSLLKPRKVLIVHGSEHATQEMFSKCKRSAIQTVLAPKLNETADVSSDVGMWRMELDRGLFDPSYALFCQPKEISLRRPSRSSSSRNKNRSNTSDVVGICYVEGIVDTSANVQLPVLRPIQERDLARSVEPQFVHTSVNRGEIFKRLQDHDENNDDPESLKINPQLSKGAIICNDSVTVSLDDSGERLQVEGPVCEIYYLVRDLVYACYENV